MGWFKMINRSIEKNMNQKKIHLIVIDDHQTRYNKILELLKENKHEVVAILLDDLESFQKRIQSEWDLVLFGRAYDLKIDQTLQIIQKSNFPELPCLVLENPDDKNEHQHVLSQLDVFDSLNIEKTSSFYTKLIRAIHFSRVLQEKNTLSDKFNAINNRVNTANEEQSDQASLIVQEGIIVDANQTVKDIFNMEDIDGFPLLDFLQPRDLDHFKAAFKAASLANLETTYIEIESDHENLSLKNPLSLKVFSDLDNDDIHVHISESQSDAVGSQPPAVCAYETLKNSLTTENIKKYLLISLDLDASAYPDILKLDLLETDQYIRELSKQIDLFFSGMLIQLSPCAWTGVIAIESSDDLKAKISSLDQLKSVDITIANGKHINTQFIFGLTEVDQPFNSQEELDVLYLQAKAHQLESNTSQATQSKKDVELLLPEDYETISSADVQYTADGLAKQQATVTSDALEIYYQQIYDKEDTQLNLYELSSNLHVQSPQVISADESVKIDQIILEKAFKELREHITTSPDTKFIISLHTTLVQQNGLLPYLTQISKVFNYAAHPHAVTLEFDFNEIDAHQLVEHPVWQELHAKGIDIALRNFSMHENRSHLIESMNPVFCYIDIKLAEIAATGMTLDQLQEQLDEYKERYPQTAFILPKLDDMNDFADAWNVDIRYLQGSYFHKKIPIA